MKVIKCCEQRLHDTAELFNNYRIFYKQEDDLDACYEFLKSNLDNNRSIIFLVIDKNDKTVAFTQLYQSFCSVEMKPICYLYDLYVDKESRGKGYSKFLMNYIIDYYKTVDIKRLTLDTAVTNTIAQNLYESMGYKKESEFITYHYSF